MLIIEGKSRASGVAVAVAAVVDSVMGINGVSPVLLQRGIEALKKGLNEKDYPEAIIVCDNLAMGVAAKIPGVRTVGIAVQSGEDIPGLTVDVPCVSDLPNLVAMVTQGELVIVDGHRGIVHLDPDPRTLIHFQDLEVERRALRKVFLKSEHIPAKTQAGELVYVYAHCFSEDDVLRALDEGADGLIVDLRQRPADSNDYYSAVLHDAAGKRVVFAVESVDDDLLRAAARFAMTHQVAVLFSARSFDVQMAGINPAVEEIQAEAHANDLDPPEVDFGIIADEHEYSTNDDTGSDVAAAIDLRESAYPQCLEESLLEGAPKWAAARDPSNTIVIIGERLDVLVSVVKAGARSIAVTPDSVGAAKYAIRSVGAEEEI